MAPRAQTVGRDMRSGPSEGLEREGPLHPCLVTDAGVTFILCLEFGGLFAAERDLRSVAEIVP